jgi:phage baseplate assembly protein W
MAGYSARLPIQVDANDGIALLQNLKQVALQNLKMLLYTEPGERVWDLKYGVGLKRYLFEQNTAFSRGQIENRIKNQISTYLPYINIINLSVDAVSPDNQIVESSNFIKINIFFNISGLGDVVYTETLPL